MTRIILYITLLFVSFSYAVVLEIHPSKEINATDMESELWIGKVYKERGIKPTKKAAKKYIQENRVLANRYLKEYKVPKNLLIETELEIDEILARKYIENTQKRLTLGEDVLKSYYIAHQSEFVRPETVVYYPIQFDDFKTAYNFYSLHKDDSRFLDDYIRENGVKRYNVPKDRIYIAIKEMFKDVRPKTLLPPTFLGDKFVLFYVKDLLPKKELDYKEVKEKIKNRLFKKEFASRRKKLLEAAKGE